MNTLKYALQARNRTGNLPLLTRFALLSYKSDAKIAFYVEILEIL